MIRVNIYKKKQDITKVTIQGHAQADDYGKDLVCAGVSAIATGVSNTIAKKGYIDQKMCSIELKNGNIMIDVLKNDETLQVILETLEISLLSFEDGYHQFIKITYKEE